MAVSARSTKKLCTSTVQYDFIPNLDLEESKIFKVNEAILAEWLKFG